MKAIASQEPAESVRDSHELPVHDVVLLLESDIRTGLSADEVKRRHEQFGPNMLPRLDRRGPVKRFLLQFHNPLMYVLLGAVIATLVVGENIDAAVIFAVVLSIAVIGYVQESRAETALDALVSMVRTESTVIRAGSRQRVDSEELVPGDVVVLEAGDKVPADMRLATAEETEIDESALTGESLPVGKSPVPVHAGTALADRANMAYSGTLVTRGRAVGVVVDTGTDTEIGHIHRLAGSAVTLQTPLTRKTARFSKVLTIAILVLAVLTFALGLLRGETAYEMLIAAVALAVSAIPEGIPAVMTITLAIGVARMARRRAIIRRLPAVETLGSTTVICTDKTGTLTANAMTVVAVSAGSHMFSVTGTGYTPVGEVLHGDQPIRLRDEPALGEALLAGALCNDSHLVEKDGRWLIAGDPTEGALQVAAMKANVSADEELAIKPRIASMPFDSGRRYMATMHRRSDGGSVVYVKGAVERLLDMAANQLARDGSVVSLDAHQLHAVTDEMASTGLRVLAFARVEIPTGTTDLHERLLDGRLTILGLQGMFDPPRPDAIDAVAACRSAGIGVKMITGDHAVTAGAIARKFGLGDSETGPVIVTGPQLSECPSEELPALVAGTDVFARVSPEQKLRLVETLQRNEHVVAMTGDGVNDAPALRRADIGVAMGVAGTEVAKESADMVLTNDNFASIEAAVEEGRGVFDNLRKFITFTLPTCMGQGLVIFVAIMLGLVLPMLPVQVLWVNMTTAIALGLVLAFEPLEKGVMRRPPIPASRPLLTPELFGRVVLVSAVMLAGAFGLFQWALDQGMEVEQARTVAVNVFVFVQVAYLLNCRSLERSVLHIGLFSNRWVTVGIATMVVLQLLYTYTPWMNQLFHSAPISGVAWLGIIGVAVVAYVLVEVEKVVRRRLQNPVAAPSRVVKGVE